MSSLSVNAELVPRRIPSVSTDAMKTMAVILDDPNPIHLDVTAVRALGLGDRLINQGPTNCGYVVDMLNENFPDGRVTRFTVRFLGNVYGGEEVIAGGKVDAVDDDEHGKVIECSIWLEAVGRGRMVVGRASVLVPNDRAMR